MSVRLRLSDGHIAVINPAHIAALTTTETGSIAVYLTGCPVPLYVRGEFEELVKLIPRSRNGARGSGRRLNDLIEGRSEKEEADV